MPSAMISKVNHFTDTFDWRIENVDLQFGLYKPSPYEFSTKTITVQKAGQPHSHWMISLGCETYSNSKMWISVHFAGLADSNKDKCRYDSVNCAYKITLSGEASTNASRKNFHECTDHKTFSLVHHASNTKRCTRGDCRVSTESSDTESTNGLVTFSEFHRRKEEWCPTDVLHISVKFTIILGCVCEEINPPLTKGQSASNGKGTVILHGIDRAD